MSGEQAMMQTIRRWFKQDGWTVHGDDDPAVLRMRCSTDEASWLCLARWVERLDVFLFEAILDTRVPEGRRMEALRFAAQMNYHSSYGSWDLDLRDGEVRFRASVDVEGMELSDQAIHNVVYGCLRGMRNHHHRFLAIIQGVRADDAFEDVTQGRPTVRPVIRTERTGDGEQHYSRAGSAEELASLRGTLQAQQASVVEDHASTRRINDAARLLVNGLFDEAITAWLSIAEAWPARAGLAWSQVGAAFYFKGDYGTAIHYYEKAKEAGEQGMDENIEEAVEAMAVG